MYYEFDETNIIRIPEKSLVEINLPQVRYRLVTEYLLYAMKLPDFGKLLSVIGEQLRGWPGAAQTVYNGLREMIYNEAAEEPEKPYHYYSAVKGGRVDRQKRYAQLEAKIAAAEKKWSK